MEPIAAYRHLGLLASVILFAGLWFIVWRWPEGKHLTFSQHVALHKHRILYYVGLFSVVLPLLLLFFVGWFAPAFKLSAWFEAFMIISALTQYACTLIPEVGGRKTTYHRFLAGVSAACLIPPIALLLGSDLVSGLGKSVAAVGLATMSGVVFLVAKGRGAHPYSLVLQSVYFAAFLGAVLFATYTVKL
jgi:hypothetical protein